MKASELVTMLKAAIQDNGDLDVRMGAFLDLSVFDVQIGTFSGEPVLEIKGAYL